MRICLALLFSLLTACGSDPGTLDLPEGGNGIPSCTPRASSSALILAGDMILEKHRLSSALGAAYPGFSNYSSQPWPGGVLPIEFAEGISETDKALAMKACSAWGNGPRITCVARQAEAGYLRVTQDESCSCATNVGSSGGARLMNMTQNCWQQASLVHEFGHVFGLMHEHQRPDRDLYVTISLENVLSSYQYAFAKLGNETFPSGPYDYESIMHYGKQSGGINYSIVMLPVFEHKNETDRMGIGGMDPAGRILELPTAEDLRVVGAVYGVQAGP